jgi:type II secretory pathway pseudopilin PulG
MKLSCQSNRSKQHAYTLIETMFATAITTIMFFTGLSAITFAKVQHTKDKERAIVTDFVVHYLETVRGLSFDNLVPGMPINPQYDGVAPNENSSQVTLRIPVSGANVSLNNANYITFCPGLDVLASRNPNMILTILNEVVGTTVRSRQLTLQVSWDSPLGYGPRQTMRLDTNRLRDIESKE